MAAVDAAISVVIVAERRSDIPGMGSTLPPLEQDLRDAPGVFDPLELGRQRGRSSGTRLIMRYDRRRRIRFADAGRGTEGAVSARSSA